MKQYEDKNIKNKVLAVLAVVLCLLMICFWTGKDENAVSTEDVKAAEEVSQKETEVLAHNAALETIDGLGVKRARNSCLLLNRFIRKMGKMCILLLFR